MADPRHVDVRVTQRDKMRELFHQHQGNKTAAVSAYAEAENAGEVNRLRNASGYGTLQYARALWADGEKKGWLPVDQASSSAVKLSTPPALDERSERFEPAAQPSPPDATVLKTPSQDPAAHFAALRNNLQTLKRARDEVDSTISQIEQWYEVAAINQPREVESYIATVREWLPTWDRLEVASQAFLPHAEYLLDGASKGENHDFSPVIIQYCRALENEFLTKLFSAYTDDLRERHSDDLESFLADAITDDKTGSFAKMLRKGDKKYTLGSMRFIMNLLDVKGKTFSRLKLLPNFREFVVTNFSENVLTKNFLDQINRITDIRNQAAHPNLIGREVAEECRSLIRECLNVFILNYRGRSAERGRPLEG